GRTAPQDRAARAPPRPAPAGPFAMSHRIRLGPPWEAATDADRTRHARKFGRPRTLDPGERVWLVCGSLPAPAEVVVNGERVGAADAAGPFAADITRLLTARNEVVIMSPSADPPADIALEIRRPDPGRVPS